MKTNFVEPTEARVQEILDEYLADLRAGRAPDREALLARHPELAEALVASFRALDFVHDAGRTIDSSGPSAEAAGAGRVLGDFRLAREIARGGMAIVYEAEQVSLGRRVALKVLPFATVLDPRQLQRFKNEAQAAAQIQHPHIVPVYAVGCDRGVHYYAMQYVEGQSLAVAIREMKEGRSGDGPATPISSHGSNREPAYVRMAAALGAKAAQALDHAHHLGIVHRDVKPGNVLVDLAGTPWITDFGLAHSRKDVGLTVTGELLGTVRYMSPEQAMAKRVPIDHRTDVYSLGATLYELFTLEPAFPGEDLHAVLQDIASKEPVPPRRLNPSLPRDLETVVLKAMAKDSSGRYATAQEMADDLVRFLEDRPVQAKRPGLLRRAAKWGRRHRALVGAVAAVLVLAVAGLATATALIWGEQQQTKAAFDRAEANLGLALEALDQIYVDEAESHPEIRQGLPRDLLQRGLDFYTEFARENLSTDSLAFSIASAHQRAGMIYRELGQNDRAAEAFDRSIASYRDAIRLKPDLAGAHNNLGNALQAKGDWDGAILELREAIRLQPNDARAHSNLGNALARSGNTAGAILALNEAIRLKPDFAVAHANLAGPLVARGDFEGAIRACRLAIGIQPDDADSHNALGSVLNRSGDRAGAIREFREALRLDPRNTMAHCNLGIVLAHTGDLVGAIQEQREAIRLNPSDAEAHKALGSALWRNGDPDGAIPEFREAIRLNPDDEWAHPDDPGARSYLGLVLFEKGDEEAGIQEFREVIRLHPNDALAHYNLGNMLADMGDLDGAIGEYREALRCKPGYADAHFNLGYTLIDRGDRAGAIASLRVVVELEPSDALAHCELGLALVGQGSFQEALPLLRKGHELGSKSPDWDRPSEKWVEATARKAELEGSVEQVLSGELRLRDAGDRIVFAELLHAKSRPAEAARMYAKAFAEDAAIVEDLVWAHRYHAACSASLASAGGGADAAEWRGRALEWLRADLDARERQAPAALASVRVWKMDSDLAAVRDRLDDLPETERDAWRRLWAAVDEALARARKPPG